MNHKREVPWDFHQHAVNEDYMAAEWQRRPYSDMAALMEAAPGEPIEDSVESLLKLRDTLADAIDALPERHRWVLEQHLLARVPLRSLGDMMNLSKSRVWYITQEALAMLKVALQDDPTILRYLNRHEENDE